MQNEIQETAQNIDHSTGGGGIISMVISAIMALATILLGSIDTWQYPPAVIQTVQIAAGIVAIIAGIYSISKNRKK